jgi:hypothetical protein
LWAIDPAQVTIIERLQPFTTGQPPGRSPLAMLDELWNIDKHRHLHLVNATIELEDIVSVQPFPGLPDVEFEIVTRKAPGPLIGRTEVGRARLVRRPGGVIAMSLPQVHVSPRLALDIAFDPSAPTYGGRVLPTLRAIADAVQDVISAF